MAAMPIVTASTPRGPNLRAPSLRAPRRGDLTVGMAGRSPVLCGANSARRVTAAARGQPAQAITIRRPRPRLAGRRRSGRAAVPAFAGRRRPADALECGLPLNFPLIHRSSTAHSPVRQVKASTCAGHSCTSRPSATIRPTPTRPATGCCCGPGSSASSWPGTIRCCRSGMRVRAKVIAVIREEMNRIGAQEFLLPSMQPA